MNTGLLLKAKKYCARKERSVRDVEQNLRKWGAEEKVIHHIIASLKNKRFIDEVRYASLFTEIRIFEKGWGKQKVIIALQRHGIHEEIILKTVAEINENNYKSILEKIILKQKKLGKSKEKIYRFCASRGFEIEKVEDILERVV